MELSQETIDSLIRQGVDLLYQIIPALIFAILFYIVGKFIVKKLINGFEKILEKRESNPELNNFLSNIVKATLYICLFIGVATILGVPAASFIGILGAAGLAIGLALQGSLSNFAGGVLILFFKPFRLGEVIVAQGHTGTVKRMGILYTHLNTFDNREVIIPNGNLANSDLINMSTEKNRRTEISVGVAYGTNIKDAKELIQKICAADDRILKDPAPFVALTNFGDSSLDLSIRVWADAKDLWPVHFDLMENINTEFEKAGIEIPFPQRVVTQLNGSEEKVDAAK